MPSKVMPANRLPTRLAGTRKSGNSTKDSSVRRHSNANTVISVAVRAAPLEATERLSASGAQLVKLYGRYDDEQATLDSQAARVRDIGVRQAMTVRTFMTGLELVGTVALGVLYWLGGMLVVNGGLTLGTLAALTILMPRTSEAIDVDSLPG